MISIFFSKNVIWGKKQEKRKERSRLFCSHGKEKVRKPRRKAKGVTVTCELQYHCQNHHHHHLCRHHWDHHYHHHHHWQVIISSTYIGSSVWAFQARHEQLLFLAAWVCSANSTFYDCGTFGYDWENYFSVIGGEQANVCVSLQFKLRVVFVIFWDI